jgi:poly(A)-specific ribonuclease
VGGDLTALNPKWFCVTESGDPAFTDVESVKKELQELKGNLKKRSHVLVGHNLFTDLIFIYKTFIGPLPDTVTGFNNCIHALFPQVIDTKYLATHEGGSMHTKSTLKDLCDELKDRAMPFMVLAEKHTDYGVKGKEHEAGYDSMLSIL